MTGNNIHDENFCLTRFLFNCDKTNIQTKVLVSAYSVKKAW